MEGESFFLCERSERKKRYSGQREIAPNNLNAHIYETKASNEIKKDAKYLRLLIFKICLYLRGSKRNQNELATHLDKLFFLPHHRYLP